MNEKLRLRITLLTDEELADDLNRMAGVEDAWMNEQRAALLREAARRIIDLRSVIDSPPTFDASISTVLFNDGTPMHCGLVAGHPGPHRDPHEGVQWEVTG